jgi:hypothetical protein
MKFSAHSPEEEMNMRHAIPLLLLVTITVTGASLGLALAAEPPASKDAVPTVFYFHGERRCTTCRSIEATASAVVREQFPERLASGTLEWKVVNFDEKENNHFIKDLGLAGSGVVIARVSPTGVVSQHKILQDVWRLARDKAGMRTYLVEEIADYLSDIE